MANDAIYDRFLNQITRLGFAQSLQEIAVEYVYSQIPDEKAISIFNKGLPVFNAEALKHKLIHDATLNVLLQMETAKDLKDFKAKSAKKKGRKTKEQAGFDMLLKDLLKVKPPKKS